MENTIESKFDNIIEQMQQGISLENVMKLGCDEETAKVILNAYNKGVSEYSLKHWLLERKYQELCVNVVEKYLK